MKSATPGWTTSTNLRSGNGDRIVTRSYCRRSPIRHVGAMSGLLALMICSGASAELQVEEDRVLFGQSAAFSGPAKGLGEAMRAGIRAAFYEANQNGGVHGRELELVSLDDGYEPEEAIENVRKLINDHGVFALIGSVGTPTARSSVPVAAEAGLPYIAPFTGAPFLRDGQWPNVINLRASYYQETEAMVAHLTSSLGLSRVAVAYQDDSFGRAGFRGAQLAMQRRELELVATAVYPRNTTAVKTALLDLRDGDPEVVIIVGAPEPVAAFIKWARKLEFGAVFFTTSFAGGNVFTEGLGSAAEGVLVTQVVPLPNGDSPTVVKEYRAAMQATSPDADIGFVSLEGYLAGRMAVVAMQEAGPEPKREELLPVLRQLGRFDIGGYAIDFSQEGDLQGSETVFLTSLNRRGQYSAIATTK